MTQLKLNASLLLLNMFSQFELLYKYFLTHDTLKLNASVLLPNMFSQFELLYISLPTHNALKLDTQCSFLICSLSLNSL